MSFGLRAGIASLRDHALARRVLVPHVTVGVGRRLSSCGNRIHNANVDYLPSTQPTPVTLPAGLDTSTTPLVLPVGPLSDPCSLRSISKQFCPLAVRLRQLLQR